MRKEIFPSNAVGPIIGMAMLVVFGVCLVGGQSYSASEKARIHPDWEQVVVDPDPLAGTIRSQIADISSLGNRRFIVAYVVEDQIDTIRGRGELRYARFDVDAGFKSAPIRVETMADWVRAATGGPLLQGTCSLEATTARLIHPGMQLEYRNTNYVAFFSYGLQDGNVPRAKLMRHSWCGGRFMTTYHDIGTGEKPSVAVGRYADRIKLLVVYGRDNGLYCRFFDTAGTAIGTEFEVDKFPVGFNVNSTDIIWNAVAQRFIVGFIRSGGEAGGCTVNNVRITWEGLVEEPIERGICDPHTGGHHTGVACDNRPFSNPNGVYAWWYEGNRESDGSPNKALRLMDANGNPTGIEVDLPASGITFPVAARREKIEPFKVQYGLIPGSYITVSTVSPFTPGEKRMAGWTFDPDGSMRMIGLVTPEHAWQVAVETLETDTVLLWRQCDSDISCSMMAPWAITVFSHFRPNPQVLMKRVSEKVVKEKTP